MTSPSFVISSKIIEESRAQIRRDAETRPISFTKLDSIALKSANSPKSGYRMLHDSEQQFSRMAYEGFQPGFDIWYAILTAFTDLLNGPRTREPPANEVLTWQMKFRLTSVALSTSKMVLDGCLNGYYSQCMALVRHLCETWKLLAYFDIEPTAAEAWRTDIGHPEPKEIKRERVIIALKESETYVPLYSAVQDLERPAIGVI